MTASHLLTPPSSQNGTRDPSILRKRCDPAHLCFLPAPALRPLPASNGQNTFGHYTSSPLFVTTCPEHFLPCCSHRLRSRRRHPANPILDLPAVGGASLLFQAIRSACSTTDVAKVADQRIDQVEADTLKSHSPTSAHACLQKLNNTGMTAGRRPSYPWDRQQNSEMTQHVHENR